MHWLVLIVASLFEAVVPLFIIRTDNFSNLPYVGLLALTMISSIAGLRYAMRVIPLSIAYMVWAALGILGTAAVGVIVLGETLEPLEILSLTVILVAAAGLRCSSAAAAL